MRCYSQYKDSGVQWLGEIPSHWEIVPMKYCIKLNNGRDYKKYESCNGIPVIGTGGQFAYSSKEMFNGEVVFFGRKGTIDKPFYYTGSFWAVDTVFYAEAKDNMICRYLYYLGTTIPFGLYSTSTAIPSMTQTDLLNNLISLPPLSEQQAIASYLDKTTAKIDEAIAQQQKMIDLLNERKQIIINNAVTKGLNPNAKMKPSGIDWIGNIPEHWEVGRLKTILKVKDKRNTDPNALLLSVFTAIGVRPRQELEERGNKATTVLNYKIVNKGDLIVNRLLAWMGAYGLSNHDGVTSPDYDVYSFHADVNKDYYETFFRNTQFKSDCYKYGHGIMMMRWRTYSDEFLNINVPIPPREEQDEIYNYLKPMIEKIDSGVSNCSQMISFLQERKQIIINDVVTGKVKII